MLQGAEWILDRLYELERAKLQYEADNRRAHALTSFLRALNETEIYYGTLRESGKDRDREEELSRTWIEVSQELCIVDLELAKRCEMKARYWADPVGWSPRQLENAHITIYEMRAALDKLLEQEKDRRHRCR
jgi:hypothetical protein